MELPTDFDETFDKIQKLGITSESAGQIRDHLIMAVRESAQPDASAGDLGLIDWSTKTLRRCEEAIHSEICDGSGGGLKDEYRKLLEKATSDDNVKQIALVITHAVALVNPALAVSSVIVYFSLWLAKVGLNYWCKQTLSA